MERILERQFKEFINEKDVLNIILTYYEDTRVLFHTDIYLNYTLQENDNIFQIIINSYKYIFIEIGSQLDSYTNIEILSYANEIKFWRSLSKENTKNIINTIYKSVKLKKIMIYYSTIDLNDVYKIMEIKSLDILHLQFHPYIANNSDLQIIYKMLCYVIDNLNKNIKIVISNYHINKKIMKEHFKFIIYNFKIKDNEFIFNYIPELLRKFDNLCDIDLYYLK